MKTKLLTIKDVARILNIGERTVYNMVNDGRLPANKIGKMWRFNESDILAIARGVKPEALTEAIRGEGAARPPYVGHNGQKPLILIVDDDKDIRLLMSVLLKNAGYRAETAANGLEALKFLQVTKPDVIVLDIVMPEMDGFELLEKIVTNPDIADIPIVFITAKKESRGNLEPFGYFLAKPLDKDVFLGDIEKALQSIKG